jgi:hypothetical protein
MPSSQPSTIPSSQPSCQPSGQPSSQPSCQPSGQPSSQPTDQPTNQPTSQPSGNPSGQPTTQPSSEPSNQPSSQPSSTPTAIIVNQINVIFTVDLLSVFNLTESEFIQNYTAVFLKGISKYFIKADISEEFQIYFSPRFENNENISDSFSDSISLSSITTRDRVDMDYSNKYRSITRNNKDLNYNSIDKKLSKLNHPSINIMSNSINTVNNFSIPIIVTVHTPLQENFTDAVTTMFAPFLDSVSSGEFAADLNSQGIMVGRISTNIRDIDIVEIRTALPTSYPTQFILLDPTGIYLCNYLSMYLSKTMEH